MTLKEFLSMNQGHVAVIMLIATEFVGRIGLIMNDQVELCHKDNVACNTIPLANIRSVRIYSMSEIVWKR